MLYKIVRRAIHIIEAIRASHLVNRKIKTNSVPFTSIYMLAVFLFSHAAVSNSLQRYIF